ncbi:MAG: type 4a pilus biogenesis protein PilO [Planctomycetota bacterium]
MDIRKYMTKDTAVMLGILAVLIICAVVFVYVPQHRKVQAARADIAAARNDLQQNARLASVVPMMIRRVEQMRRLYDKDWEKKLPAQTNLGQFVRQISHFRDVEGLSGSLIEPGSPEQTNLYNALPITMRVRGRFEALGRFLRRLEEMDRLVRIREMSITTESDETPVEVEVMMQMSIYHREAEI